MTLWVITTCGGKKLPHPGPCEQMYRGPFAQKQMRVARVLAGAEHLILSNKYGYMRPGTMIAPYDSHWGYPDTMPDKDLSIQIDRLGFKSGDQVIHTGARVYADQSVRLMPPGVRVYWLPGMLPDSRIGYQSRLYSQIINLRSLPSGWEKTRIR